jgi:uncharacterized protein (TIGR03437 family)
MCKTATVRVLLATTVLAVLAGAPLAAQAITDWRHVGNSVTDEGLAGPAGGPVDRAWYSPDGATLYVHTSAGRVFQTIDLETWQLSSARVPLNPGIAPVPNLPETGAQARMLPGENGRAYAFGDFVYRSDDGGLSWENVTAEHGGSIVGTGLHDLAIAPGNVDEIVVAGDAGVFRSADGGRSWSGLNDGLPNLPATRLLNLPAGAEGVRIALLNDAAAEWPPGQKEAWLPADNTDLINETQLRMALSSLRGTTVSALAIAGDFVYTGMQNGEIRVSSDRGSTWRSFSTNDAGAVERFWVDPQDPRIALAALGAAPVDPFRSTPAPHVLHTINGGAFWDDVTANLPDVAAYGVAADRASGAMYVATSSGVFMSYADLSALGGPQPWSPLPGLPAASAMDVKLDAQGNQLWAALDGYGVYATLAPHRLRDPNVVSAADMIARAVAPGSLVSILGAQVDTVRTNDLSTPVLAATPTESQIQIPFEAGGSSVSLAASAAGSGVKLPSLPLASAAPVIFVSPDGSPMLLDADQGVMLDAMMPARSGTRIQILATGLGRVIPDWPTGVPAPLENPPRVAGTVHVYLDRAPVEVTRAELAPGYIGFYLVEITVPKIVNYGPAELYLDVDGIASNRVRVYIEP